MWSCSAFVVIAPSTQFRIPCFSGDRTGYIDWMRNRTFHNFFSYRPNCRSKSTSFVILFSLGLLSPFPPPPFLPPLPVTPPSPFFSCFFTKYLFYSWNLTLFYITLNWLVWFAEWGTLKISAGGGREIALSSPRQSCKLTILLTGWSHLHNFINLKRGKSIEFHYCRLLQLLQFFTRPTKSTYY